MNRWSVIFTNRLHITLALAFSSLILQGSPALAQVLDTSTPKASASDNAAASAGPLTDLERFNIIEKRYFGHGFPNDAIEDRLFRMENLVFGSKSHAPMPERIFKLEAVLGKAAAPQGNAALNPGESVQTTPAAPVAAVVPVAPLAPLKDAPKTFTSLYDQAMADIDNSRFHAAADELEQAIQLNPNNAKAYSTLGNVLLRLQDREGAKEAFRACFQVDPFGGDGRNAKAMLLKMVNDDTVRATAPQDTPQVVQHTIQTLNTQAADLAGRYRQDGNRWANYRRYLGNIEAQKITFDTNQYLYGNGFGYGGRYHRYGGYGGYGGGMTAYNRREISNMGRLQSNYVRTDFQVQANKARIEAAQKAAFVQESAANLKDQLLKGAVLKDDAKLKALGTSLYCRYFGDDTPSVDEPPVPEDPIVELKARAIGLTHR